MPEQSYYEKAQACLSLFSVKDLSTSDRAAADAAHAFALLAIADELRALREQCWSVSSVEGQPTIVFGKADT